MATRKSTTATDAPASDATSTTPQEYAPGVLDVIAALGALPTQADVARALGMRGSSFRDASRSLGVYVTRGGVWNADVMHAVYDARPGIARRVDALAAAKVAKGGENA